jgi:NADPH:quinone reductase-like Zn-dependent oxidoreductase
MNAIVYERYGPPEVLEPRQVPVPEPGDDEVLIRVHAASLNKSDWETLTGRPLYAHLEGPLRPRHTILGSDVSGTVEAVGTAVTEFEAGDDVFGDTLYWGKGGFAEYVCVSERAPLVAKPAGVTFAQAAAIPQSGVLGLQGLRHKGPVQRGRRVLINGAGGGGGSFAIQIAKSLDAEVTGVDHQTKLEMMRAIGADRVIDYTREDYTAEGERYDQILDFVGSRSLFANRRALRPEGTYLVVGGPVRRLLQAAVVGSLVSKLSSDHLGVLVAGPSREDLSHLAGLVEKGTISPIIDRQYALSEVPEALAQLGAGRVNGKAVITM